MEFYRRIFPTATVLPKMHILEDHVVLWLKRWHIGSGLMGEQGAESIHAHIQKLETQYHGIVSDLNPLDYVVREHNIHNALYSLTHSSLLPKDTGSLRLECRCFSTLLSPSSSMFSSRFS